MSFLYIGQYQDGSTSKMRANALKEIYGELDFAVIDTDIPFSGSKKIYRSIGFRFKSGPLIKKVNDYIIKNIGDVFYDIIWVDKAIFVSLRTTKILKSLTNKLVHFTPDMAFYSNQSYHFNKCIRMYDYLITTKTAEKDKYLQHYPSAKMILTTQGYDPSIHKSDILFSDKSNKVAFIGLCEPFRCDAIQKLIDNNIFVKLAGKGWERFVKKNKENLFLEYYGEVFFLKEYSEFIASAKFSLGLLSKKFPELHTTRTFEIPACGTALLSERNVETTSFFKEDEAIFYDTLEEMVYKIKHYQSNLKELETLTNKGYRKVVHHGYDYESILRKVFIQIGIK